MRVLIVGSCVSRDAFNLEHQHTLVDYIARTSLASAFRPPFRWLTDERLSRIESSFQRRLVDIDARKRLSAILQAADYDVLLLDLIDERFSLVTIDGDTATYSSEMAKTGIGNEPAASVVKPDDGNRMSAWIDGLGHIIDICRQKHANIILNRVWWSRVDDQGEPFQTNAVETGNKHLARLYSHIPASITQIEYPDGMLVGSSAHRWGRSPFHFAEVAYRHLIESIHHHH